MENRPTKKQRELLSFIDGFIKGNGYGPSYREIMRALDYKSVSTVAKHVDGLIARGLLLKKDKSARTLEVVSSVQTPNVTKIPTNTLEKVIREKIQELRGDDNQANIDDILALERTLQLLGYNIPENDLV